jgi:hypothetical protein
MDASIPLLLLVVATIAVGGSLWYSNRRRKVRRLYRRALESALVDGTISSDEIAELDRIREDGDIKPAEVRMVALAIYRGALRNAMADEKLTPEEDEALQKLQAQLGLSERDLGDEVDGLARLRLLARVERGDLPSVESPIALVPHETCHWVVQATLAERIDLRRHTNADIVGIEQTVNGQKPFNAAGHREALRPNEEILPVDLGMFVVTSRRAIFQGARRNVSVPHARLDSITLYADGVRIDEPGDNTRGFILLDDADITTAILLQAARRRREEIKPVRGGRTA